MKPSHPKTLPPPRRSPWRAIGFAVPLALLLALVVYASLSEAPTGGPERAVSFALPATDGRVVTLEENLARGETLLYFSMGVGCDGCFMQIPEIEAGLAARGITLVPIMVDPVGVVAEQAARFGITTPILIDADRSVADAYEMLGVYGHSDRPSHSFALVAGDGTVEWIRHYAEMFVPADALFAELDAALASA